MRGSGSGSRVFRKGLRDTSPRRFPFFLREPSTWAPERFEAATDLQGGIGSGSWVSGFGFRDRVSVFRLRVSGLDYRASGTGLRVSVFGYPASGIRLRVSRLRVSGSAAFHVSFFDSPESPQHQFEILSRIRISGIGYWGAGGLPFNIGVLSPAVGLLSFPVFSWRHEHPKHLPQIQRGHLCRVGASMGRSGCGIFRV